MSNLSNISPNKDLFFGIRLQDEEEEELTILLLSMMQDKNAISILVDDAPNNRNHSSLFPRRFVLAAQAVLNPCLYRTEEDSKETFSLQGKYNFTLASLMVLSLIMSIITGVKSHHDSKDKSAYPLSFIFGGLSILCFLGIIIVAGLRHIVPKKVLAPSLLGIDFSQNIRRLAASSVTPSAVQAAIEEVAPSSVAPSYAERGVEAVASIDTSIISMRRKIKEIKKEVKYSLILQKTVEGTILVEKALEIVLQHNKSFLEQCSLLDKEPSLFFWRASRQQLSTAIRNLENLMHIFSGIQRVESKNYDFRLRDISHTR